MPMFVKGMRLASAICVVILVFMTVFDTLSPFHATAPAMEIMRSESGTFSGEGEEILPAEEAPIITYHTVEPEEYGIGGGGDEDFLEPDGTLLPDAVMSPDDDQPESSALAVEGESELDSGSSSQTAEGKGISEGEANYEPPGSTAENTGPILGIQPEEEQGTFEKSDEYLSIGQEKPTSPVSNAPLILYMFEILLGIIAVLLFLTSEIFRKRWQ